MDSIVITGGNPLVGEIKISGAKNASLPIMTAALLTDQPLTLSHVPQLSDIATMSQLLRNHGVIINEQEETDQSLTITLTASNVNNLVAPYDIVRKMRASIWVLGPLLARFGSAKVSLPGGCAIGARQVDLHIAVLEAMGAKIDITDGYIDAKVKGDRLKACDFLFSKISVGATITAILAAVLADGETRLSNCAQEPEISDLCICLQKMGATINGVGSSELHIVGREHLHAASHIVLPDRIEAGTYMLAAAMTRGNVHITGINYDIVKNLALKMKEAGVHIEQTDDGLIVRHSGEIKPVDIATQPYPGLATDLQAQFMSFMTISSGVSTVTENIFENRFMHVPELCRMGANIIINGHSATVYGTDSLKGAEVMASDLRASVSLILAGLVAKGQTKIRRVYHLDRGYQSLEAKLSACGADIRRISGDSV